MFPVHQVWPKPFYKAQLQWKGEEEKADKGRGGKTTSGSGQAWSSASPRGQWRTEKMEETGCKIICGAPTTLAVKGLMMMMMMMVCSPLSMRYRAIEITTTTSSNKVIQHAIVVLCITIILSDLQARMKLENDRIMTRMTEHKHTYARTLSRFLSKRKAILQRIADGYEGHADWILLPSVQKKKKKKLPALRRNLVLSRTGVLVGNRAIMFILYWLLSPTCSLKGTAILKRQWVFFESESRQGGMDLWLFTCYLGFFLTIFREVCRPFHFSGLYSESELIYLL